MLNLLQSWRMYLTFLYFYFTFLYGEMEGIALLYQVAIVALETTPVLSDLKPCLLVSLACGLLLQPVVWSRWMFCWTEVCCWTDWSLRWLPWDKWAVFHGLCHSSTGCPMFVTKTDPWEQGQAQKMPWNWHTINSAVCFWLKVKNQWKQYGIDSPPFSGSSQNCIVRFLSQGRG